MSIELNNKDEKTPNILWAQTSSKVYITVMIGESKNNTFEIKDNKIIKFESTSEDKNFKFEFELDDLVKDYSMNITSRKVTISIDKCEEGWWMKLTDNPLYKNNVKVDWERWQDEDDIEDENMGMPYVL